MALELFSLTSPKVGQKWKTKLSNCSQGKACVLSQVPPNGSKAIRPSTYSIAMAHFDKLVSLCQGVLLTLVS